MKSVSTALRALILSSLPFEAMAESSIATEDAISCFDDAMFAISEEMLGRSYTAEEHALKQQAMEISPEHRHVLRIMAALSEMPDATVAAQWLKSETDMEEWMIKIVTGCSFYASAW